jgi:hypothetical protein
MKNKKIPVLDKGCSIFHLLQPMRYKADHPPSNRRAIAFLPAVAGLLVLGKNCM